MKKYVILIISGLLALVSCQEELNINRDTLSIPVTKSDDSALTLDSITSSHNSDESELKTKPAPSPSRTSPTKWAVILNGGYCTNQNLKLYWNDCQLMYQTLTQELGYPSNQIYCLISDGIDGGDDRKISDNNTDSSPTDLDGDGYRDVYYSASLTDLYSVFNALRYEVSDGDEVLVFVTGPSLTSGFLNLWDPLGFAKLYPYNLDYLLGLLGTSVNIDVILGQSFSESFISSICAENRTIVAATGCESEIIYDDSYDGNSLFVSKWTDAICSINPSVTGTFSNGDGYLSSFEIFKYAEQAILDDYSIDEAPKMNPNGPDLFAWGHDLEGNSFVPYLDGPDYAEQSYYGTYTFYGLPSTYSCSWSYSNNLRKISSTGTSVTMAGNLNSASQIVSFGADVTAQFTDIGETFSMTKDIESVWKAGQYMNLNYIQGGNGVYYIGGYNWSGPYGYYWECEEPAWQITSQNNNFVYISEGYTSNPVPLMVTFYNPLGGMTYVFDYVND